MQFMYRTISLSFLFFVLLAITSPAFASDDDWVTENGVTKLPSGSVAIGNIDPEGKLDVNGDVIVQTLRVRTNNKDTTTDIQMGGNANLATTTSLAIIMDSDNDNGNSYIMFGSNSPNRTNLQEYMRINEEGRLGIGTSSPSGALDVGDYAGAAIKIRDTRGNPDIVSGDIAGGRIDFIAGEDWKHVMTSIRSVSSGTWYRTTHENGASGYADIVFYTTPFQNLNGVIDEDDPSTLTESVRITHDGNMGIGTSDPEKLLHVASPRNASVTLGDAPAVLMLEQANNNNWSYGEAAGEILFKKGDDIVGAIRSEHTRAGGPHTHEDAGLTFYVAPNAETPVPFEAMRIDYLGHVGIGTTNTTDHKLNVAGTIRANEIIVDTSGADYVFGDDYELKPLDQINAFIDEHKHLPDIPSANEMKENGMGMAEMQTKLLAKIEELTLYLIAQQKEIEELKAQIGHR